MINNERAIKILQSLFHDSISVSQVYEGSDKEFILMREGVNAGTKGTGYFDPNGTPTLYMGLYTTLPDTKGENGQEVNRANNYQRIPLHGQDIYNNGYIFTGAEILSTDSDGMLAGTAFIENKQDIIFPVATGEGWGQVIGFGLFTEATDGKLLLWGKLTNEQGKTPEPIENDTILKIAGPKYDAAGNLISQAQFRVTFS